MRQKNWKHTAAHIGALAMMSAWGHAAVAAQATPTPQAKNSAPVLEEILVSARKFEERLQDAPVAVSTLSGATLEERGIRDLVDTAKLTSSVKIDADGDVRAGVSIRGVGGSGDTNAAPGVGLFVDGVYQPASAYFTVPFFDVERMEVLKGPQGTLYGKNTMGGAINIISRAPTKELGGALSVEAATGDQKVLNGVINLPITDDFGNRTAVFYRKTDGLQENKNTGENPSYREDFMARTRFVYDPESGLKSSLSLFAANLRSAPFAYSKTNEGLNHPIDNVVKDTNGLVVSKYQGANLTNSYDFGPATVTAITSYDKGDVDTEVDGDYIDVPATVAGGTSHRKTFAQELRFTDSSTESSGFHWLAGGYYSNDKLISDSFAVTNFGYLPGSLGLFYTGKIGTGTTLKDETTETYAAFGQVTWVVDKFEFVAGLRHDKEIHKNDTSSIDALPGVAFGTLPFPPFVYPIPIVTTSTTSLDREVTSQEWQPKASVSYHFTPDVMGYGLVSRGFRAAGFNPVTAPPGYTEYSTETTTNYEGGLKTELFDRRLRLNSAIFYTDYTDILQTDIVLINGQQTVVSKNGGAAKSYGFEFDAAYQVTQELTISGGYTHLDVLNEKVPPKAIRRRASGFAPDVFNLQANYMRPIGEMTFGAHASANYIGSTPMATETDWRDASTVVDASLDLTVQDITFSVFGKNIFNEKYYLSYIPSSSTFTQRGAIGLLNQPTQYGVRVSTTF